jgi:predicted dehydrogenase
MIPVGIIGYGYWGPNLARCTAEADGCTLAAIADAAAEARARAAKRHNTAVRDDWRDLVADPNIAAVMIATPARTHFEIALAALHAGKHVLVEKPMTETSAQALVLIEEAAKRNLTLMVDHTFVYTGAVRKIREMIDEGLVGDVFYYDSTRVNLGLFQHDVNVIWDLAVHDLAILDYLLDCQPVAVSANGAGHLGRLENMAQVTIYFAGGTTAHLNVNWLAPVKIRQTLIGGSRRMIVYDDLQPSEKIKVYDRGVDVVGSQEELYRLLVSYRTGDMWAPQISVKEALMTEIEHFIDCITTQTAPLTSGGSGLRVVEMLENASLSLQQRGHPIEFTPLRRAS